MPGALDFVTDAWNGVGAPSAGEGSFVAASLPVFSISVDKADPVNALWDGPVFFTFPFSSVYGGFSEGGSVSTSARPTIMRPEPLTAYLSPSQRSISVTIQLFPQVADSFSTVITGANSDGSVSTRLAEVESSPAWCRQQALFLDALSRPIMTPHLRGVAGGNRRMSPPVVTVTIGAILRMRAVVSACSIRWHEMKRSTPNGYDLLSAADVAMTFDASSTSFSNYRIGSPGRNGGGL